MVLDTEIEEYLPLSTEVGFKVMIHEPGVESDYNRNGVHIPPEFASYLQLTKVSVPREKMRNVSRFLMTHAIRTCARRRIHIYTYIVISAAQKVLLVTSKLDYTKATI